MRKNNTKKPFFSIIVPAYNCEEYINKAIDSVLKQDFEDYELIIVDDGSKDKTGDICKGYNNSKIIYLYKKNGGVSSARNYGLKVAKGKYIMFLDSDDYYEEKCLSTCYEYINDYMPDILKISYKSIYKKISKKYNYLSITNKLIKKEDYDKYIYNNIFTSYDFTNVWTMVIKSDIAKEILFSDYIVAEDFLYSYSCIEKSKNIIIVDKPLYNYICNYNSITRSFDFEKNILKFNEEIEVLNIIYNNLRDNNYYKLYSNRIIKIKTNTINNVCFSLNYKNTKKYLNIINKKLDKKIKINYLKYMYIKMKMIIKNEIKKI